jgi:GTP-binding protein HflX
LKELAITRRTPPATPGRAFLVGAELKGDPPVLRTADSLAELGLLAQTAGLTVAGQTAQKLGRISSATYVGSGKLEEIQALVDETGADVVIFDDELSPRHQRELEKAFGDGVRVLDRTALILDIFAQHAHTREGALQVELAQYQYRLPRLTRQWTHLARQAGGGGGRGGAAGVGLRGPGETQLEIDRTEIRRRLTRLEREIEAVRRQRQQHRARRRRSAVPVVAIVGYTNAGKSTLLNTLSRAGVLAADQLFATLDPTTRRVALPGGKLALFTDTVGFIQKLPTTLVAAFRATLEEIAEADLLLHIIDLTHPNAREQARVVELTLDELGARDRPMVTVLNKIDRLAPGEVAARAAYFAGAVPISAQAGAGMPELLAEVERALYTRLEPIRVRLTYRRADLIARFHEQGVVDQEEHDARGVWLTGRLPAAELYRFRPFAQRGPGAERTAAPGAERTAAPDDALPEHDVESDDALPEDDDVEPAEVVAGDESLDEPVDEGLSDDLDEAVE